MVPYHSYRKETKQCLYGYVYIGVYMYVYLCVCMYRCVCVYICI